MKFKQNEITNLNGVSKPIIVKSLLPNKPVDLLIGVAIIGVGVAYLTATAFKNGSRCFELAEFNAMKELDIV